MTKENDGISMRTAALVAGLPVMLFTAPYAEFYVFGNLIVSNDAAQTTQNLLNNQKLFLSGIFAMLLTFIYDIVLAWALYIFLKPVNAWLAMLSVWLRVAYAAVAIVALFNYLYAYQLLRMPGFDDPFKNERVLLLLNARAHAMNLGYFVFAGYLILQGILMYKASYIPKVLGVLIMLAGLAWLIHSVQPYFLRGYNVSWIKLLGIGELVFAIWLLVKGTRIKESELAA